MPRNSSGIYSLPLPPVVTGTIIASDWANPTLADIESAMTDSLDRQGRGSMAAPLRITDGTATTPALAFASQTSSGLYRDPGANAWALAFQGAPMVSLTPTGVVVSSDMSIVRDPAATFSVESNLDSAGIKLTDGAGGVDNKRVQFRMDGDDLNFEFIADDDVTTRPGMTLDAATSNLDVAGELRANGVYDTGSRVYSAVNPPPGEAPGGDPDSMVGTVVPWTGSLVDIDLRGWLACDGASYLEAAWPELYAVMEAEGFPFGQSGGAGTFQVPNIESRVVGGAGTGAGLSTRAMGDELGEEEHLNLAAESGVPAHTHTIPAGASGGNAARGGSWDGDGGSTTTRTADPNTAANAAQAHNNMQPTVFMHWIIKAATSATSAGEKNVSTTPATVGANEADINMPKSGVTLPKKKLVGGSNITLENNADNIVINGQAGGGGGSKWVIDSEGSEMPPAAQGRTSLNLFGNGVLLQDNAAQDRIDVQILNANAVNVGGGAEVLRDITPGDPSTVNLRTIVAGTGATVTELADTIVIGATGAGGGEVNSAQNIGGGVEIANETNNGVLIPVRTLDAGQFELNGDQARIQAGTYDDFGDAATVQGNLDTHTGNSAIHFPVSDLPGDGLVQAATALDVGAGDGISVAADAVSVDATVARKNINNLFTASQGITGGLGVSGDISAGNTISALPTAGAATLNLWGTTGAANNRYFSARVGSTAGQFDLTPVNDAGTPVAGRGLFMGHAGGAALGAPIGGVPVTNGVLNAEGLQVNGVNVSLGSGLTAGSPFVNGDLASVDGASSIRSVGFAAPDVARYSTDNTFVGTQVIDSPGAATYAFLPGIGGTETRNFLISAVAGNFTWQPLDSGLSAVNPPMDFSHEGGLGLGNPTGGTPSTAGHINAKAFLIDNVPIGGGDPNAVSSINPTVDGEVQLGDSATRGLKGSGVQMDRVLRDDNPATIGEVGIDATPTALATASSPVSPTLEGNAFYDLDGLDATVVNLPTTGNGTLCIQVSNTVPAVTFNPPPDVESGTFLSGTPWRAYITRIGSTRMVEWVG